MRIFAVYIFALYQVRTLEMHQDAEGGVASHSLYKAGLSTPEAAQEFTAKMIVPGAPAAVIGSSVSSSSTNVSSGDSSSDSAFDVVHTEALPAAAIAPPAQLQLAHDHDSSISSVDTASDIAALSTVDATAVVDSASESASKLQQSAADTAKRRKRRQRKRQQHLHMPHNKRVLRHGRPTD
jgi:hypothetical protein